MSKLADPKRTRPQRASTGGAFESHGAFFMRITVAPQKRRAAALPWCTTLPNALERANAVQALVNRLRAAKQTDFVGKLVELAAGADDAKMAKLTKAVDEIAAGEAVAIGRNTSGAHVVTFQTFATRWTSGDLHRAFPDHVREKRSADTDTARLAKHVYPVIGDLPLASLRLDDALEVMRRLPASLSPASRRHVAQLMSRVLSLAVYPCRELEASPLPRGFLPRLRNRKALSALYPDEEAKLIACTSVPLPSRLLYGFIAREGMRSSEALALTWADLDLKRGAVRLDKNKTDDPRAWALDQGTALALSRWRDQTAAPTPDALVFGQVLDRGHLAADFREHLVIAGIDRAELFEDSESRRRVRFHDLRATFVTVALAVGRSEGFVTAKTGHRSSMQVSAYRRLAQTFADLGASWFVNMAEAIPELAAANTAPNAAAPQKKLPTKNWVNPLIVHGTRLELVHLSALEPKDDDGRTTGEFRGDSDDAETLDEREAPSLPRSAAASDAPGDAVEAALAKALEGATAAGRWDVVTQVARELEARRLASSPNVVPLGAAKKKGGGR